MKINGEKATKQEKKLLKKKEKKSKKIPSSHSNSIWVFKLRDFKLQ
jgi:hypothetical protein